MTVRSVASRLARKVSPELFEHRYLLVGLVKNSLKGKYNNSALGILWHIINPVMQIVVYALVFSVVFGKTIENYWAYLSVGVFAYNFFSSSMNSGTNSIVSHRGMVTKMYFPRELLVYSNILVNLTTFSISYAVLIGMLAVLGFVPNLWYVALVPVVIMLEAFFITGLVLATSALNVFYRDMSYGMPILTMLLMFMTPIFYMADRMGDTLHSVLMFNPMMYYVETLHGLLYYGTLPSMFYGVMCMVLALAAFIVGHAIFKRLEPKIPEKL